MEYTLIGNHPAILKIRELISVASETAFNVLLLGETGTGKEVVARLLHHASARSKKRFLKVNCAALPLTLLESELFGYEKGAFTGADKPKPGKFEVASEGVIFLDEIGDMPPVLQSKLLHVLQTGEFTRLGGTTDIKVNTWVIAATNHDLEKDIRSGLFREDLYYRLNIIRIEIPPLRERTQDIPLLTKYFIHKYQRELGIDQPFKLSSELSKTFQNYHWPGNVRELSSAVLRLLLGDDLVEVQGELLDNMTSEGLAPSEKLTGGTSEEIGGEESGGGKPVSPKSLKELSAESTKYIERKAILHALKTTGWNKRQAARMLKISYKALFYKINGYGLRNERRDSRVSKNGSSV
jgi:transcriptional regulator with PAS, ATPase and Fis domain